MKILERVLTREIPVLYAQPYLKGLNQLTGDIVGFRLPETFMVFADGTAYFYRPSEWFTELPAKLSRAVKDKKIMAEVMQAVEETKKSSRAFESPLKLPELLSNLEKGVPGLQFAYWIHIFNEKKKQFDKDTAEALSKARLSIEGFFNLAVRAYFKYLQSLPYPLDLLKYATEKEITGQNINLDELKKRKNTAFLFSDKLIFGWKNIHAYLKSKGYVIKQEAKSAETLKGITAYPGKARGKARIILSREHFCKFRPGEILVSAMTSPDYIPLMQKAAGIITDEGGVLSHAAIVARELKKSCIIGTKIATRVFKDGDTLEIDEGIIRKINK